MARAAPLAEAYGPWAPFEREAALCLLLCSVAPPEALRLVPEMRPHGHLLCPFLHTQRSGSAEAGLGRVFYL